MSYPRWTLALLPLLGVLAGCTNSESTTGSPTTTSSSSSSSGSSGTTEDPCDAMRDECFGKQRICVVKDGAAECEACPAAHYASAQGTCEALDGEALSNDFSDFTVKSGEEVKGQCQSWTLHNKEEIWVNAVELTQDEGSHHSNWTFVPDDKYTGDDGVWKCSERSYSEVEAAIYGGVIYAQSTQAAHEVQKFPNGAAVRIPPYSRIIGDVHLLNATQDDITGHAKLTLYSLAANDVKIKLAPIHFTYSGLNIPPHADSRFSGTCDLASQFAASSLPFKMDIYFVLPHYHSLGKAFFLDVAGGPKDKERILDVGAYDGEAHGRSYDPPYRVEGATGLSFGCDFTNPRDEYIKYGLGDQEMCEMLGFVDSALGFEAKVDTADPAGDDGKTQLFTGQCNTLGLQWDQNKPGGKGP